MRTKEARAGVQQGSCCGDLTDLVPLAVNITHVSEVSLIVRRMWFGRPVSVEHRVLVEPSSTTPRSRLRELGPTTLAPTGYVRLRPAGLGTTRSPRILTAGTIDENARESQS